MTELLTIGDFARMTFLKVKTLRYYHDVGLLKAADVDPFSGYRRYSVEQAKEAQVIRRLRDLAMPLDDIAEVKENVPAGSNRTHPDIATKEYDDELARLRGLGATVVEEHNVPGIRYITLADPDGNNFDLADE